MKAGGDQAGRGQPLGSGQGEAGGSCGAVRALSLPPRQEGPQSASPVGQGGAGGAGPGRLGPPRLTIRADGFINNKREADEKATNRTSKLLTSGKGETTHGAKRLDKWSLPTWAGASVAAPGGGGLLFIQLIGRTRWSLEGGPKCPNGMIDVSGATGL